MPGLDIHHSINSWISGLNKYSLAQLQAKPSPKSWSLGQLYLHLIAETTFYFEQIRLCLSHNDHADAEASAVARCMFLNDAFPDEDIEGAPSNDAIPQPKSKEELCRGIHHLKEMANELTALIATHSFSGKTKHPGLGYFSAAQWLQFAGMHFRHHLRQRKKIESFFAESGVG